MKPLLFFLVSFLALQTASAQDYLKSKFRTFQEQVTVPFEHPAAKRIADPEYTYYIELYNIIDGACVYNVIGFDDWVIPYNVCAWDHALGGYDTPTSSFRVDVHSTAAYDIVLYVNEYEWVRRSAPAGPYIQHVFNTSALGGFNIIIAIEPYTGDM